MEVGSWKVRDCYFRHKHLLAPKARVHVTGYVLHCVLLSFERQSLWRLPLKDRVDSGLGTGWGGVEGTGHRLNSHFVSGKNSPESREDFELSDNWRDLKLEAKKLLFLCSWKQDSMYLQINLACLKEMLISINFRQK